MAPPKVHLDRNMFTGKMMRKHMFSIQIHVRQKGQA
jgi:hypothetical protein